MTHGSGREGCGDLMGGLHICQPTGCLGTTKVEDVAHGARAFRPGPREVVGECAVGIGDGECVDLGIAEPVVAARRVQLRGLAERVVEVAEREQS